MHLDRVKQEVDEYREQMRNPPQVKDLSQIKNADVDKL